jgi:membrane-associated phospholipid phosphatase
MAAGESMSPSDEGAVYTAAAGRSGELSPGRSSAADRQGRPSPPLLAASVRPWAGALLACCAILVAVLGVVFAHQTTADPFDRAVDSPVISWLGGHHGLLLWLAAPGSYLPAAVLTVVIVVACLVAGRLNGAVLGAMAVPVAVGLNDGLLKHLVHRTYLGALSYPSGHTAAVFALAGTTTVLLLPPPRPARGGVWRVLIPAAAWVVGVVVAIAVIGLQWHYLTDTVAGAAIGIGTVFGLALILDLPVPGRWLTQAGRWRPAARRRP